jgi:hypothetical protein
VGWWLSGRSVRLEHMFDTAEGQGPAGAGVGAGYGDVWPVRPGVVDPVRAAALVEAIEAGVLVWDPAEEALFGPDPEVDVAALFAALDAASATPGAGTASDAGDDADGEGVWPSAAADASDAPAVPTGLPPEVADPRVLVPQRMPSVEDMPPGSELARLLDGADVSAVRAYEPVEAIAGWQRMASWAAARQAAAITE